jgi:hypothetical protein
MRPEALRTDCISPGEHTPRVMDARDAVVDMLANSIEVTETAFWNEHEPPNQADIDDGVTMQSPFDRQSYWCVQRLTCDAAATKTANATELTTNTDDDASSGSMFPSTLNNGS